MSLRPEAIGFNLEQLTQSFGGKDLKLAKRLDHIPYETDMVTDDGQRYCETANKIVNGELAPKSLETESSLIALIVIDIARIQEGALESDLSFWTYDEDYFKWLKNLVSEENKPLVQYFLSGRPLFGKSFEDDMTIYAYFSKEELDQLLEEINQNPQKYYDDEGFGEALHTCLKTCAEHKKDMFFFTN